MKKIFKYQFHLIDYPQVLLPKGAEILDIASQHGRIWMWALVNPDETDIETRKFRVAGTGHPIKEGNLKHLRTFQMRDGDLIIHVFEI